MQPVVDAMGDMDDSGYQGMTEARPFWHSREINAIAGALAKAQGVIEGALKDSANPFFKSKYADLASVWAAARKPLTDNEIAVVQSPSASRDAVTVTTMLVHCSGQFFASVLTMTAKDDTPQGIGSCITYARRYALSALVGVAPEDDDGNAASGRTGEQRAAQNSSRPPMPTPPAARPVPAKTESSSESAMLNDMATTAGALKVFAKLKDGLGVCLGKEAGERKYYQLLGSHGVEHENEFKSSGPAKACAKEMLNVISTADGLGI